MKRILLRMADGSGRRLLSLRKSADAGISISFDRRFLRSTPARHRAHVLQQLVVHHDGRRTPDADCGPPNNVQLWGHRSSYYIESTWDCPNTAPEPLGEDCYVDGFIAPCP